MVGSWTMVILFFYKTILRILFWNILHDLSVEKTFPWKCSFDVPSGIPLASRNI